MGTGGSSPCASCKLLRRRCAKDCIFAPYFPPDDPQRFAIVHKVFGASNVSKMLQELPVHQRGDAVSSLVYEANARVRDPVYGCVGAISYLQSQVSQLQTQLAVAQAEIMSIQMQQEAANTATITPTTTDDIAAVAASLQQLGDEDDNKSLLMSTAPHNCTNHPMHLHQYVNLAVSTAGHVIQDPLFKRESLWT